MLRITLLYFFAIAIITTASAQDSNKVFDNKIINSIALKNIDNGQLKGLFKLLEKPTVFIFLSPECPLCQNYTTTLNALKTAPGNDVNMYGIVPGKAYSTADITAFKKKYQILFPLFIDGSKKLTNYLGATVTPQVILIDSNGKLLYTGAIDNWAVSLAKRRPAPTEFYLQNAISQSLSHNVVTVKTTNPVGCKINDF